MQQERIDQRSRLRDPVAIYARALGVRLTTLRLTRRAARLIAPPPPPMDRRVRNQIMTAEKLTDLLVAALVRDHGKSKHHWRKVIGPIRLYSPATHPHCNWTATPTGGFQDIALIETLLDDLRMAHPLLTA